MAVDVELLRTHFFSIAPKVDELMETFYATLFLRYPDVVPLFDSVDMPRQRKLMANAMVFVLENLEVMDVAGSTIEAMGRRHVGYRAQAKHYPVVGECLIHALATVSGDQWNDELQTQWTEAYGVISSIMIEGAEKSKKITSAN